MRLGLVLEASNKEPTPGGVNVHIYFSISRFRGGTKAKQTNPFVTPKLALLTQKSEEKQDFWGGPKVGACGWPRKSQSPRKQR